MKMLVFSCLLIFLIPDALGLGYHQDVGIPEAARIRQLEAQQMSARIIGGLPSQYGDNPHLAGLIITLTTGQMSVCSGTLLSSKKVLTAGQCWYDGYSQGKNIQVVLGGLRLFYGSRYDVSGVSVHPGFNPKLLTNDLAMLTLRWTVNFYSYQLPAILPSLSEVNTTFAGVSARVSGYGKTSDSSAIGPNTEQHAVSVPVESNSWYNCLYSLPQRPSGDYNNLICTSGSNGWGTCGGDLGGPLVVDDYYNQTAAYNGSALLIGVTSIQSPFGCQTGFPTGYMRVTSYLGWILKNL